MHEKVMGGDTSGEKAPISHLKRHSLLYFIGRGAASAINLLSITVFARLLGADGYGLFALVMSGTAMANGLLFQWLRLALVRYLPAYRENRSELISNIVFAHLSISIFILLVFPFLLYTYNTNTIINMVFIAILIAIGWFDLGLEMARADLRPIYYSTMNIFKSIISFLLGLAFIWLGGGAYGALAGQFVGLAVVGGIACFQQWHTKTLRFQREIARQLLAYGFPLSLTTFLFLVTSYLDRFLIALFIDQHNAGIYAAIYDVVYSIFLFVMQISTSAGFPLAVQFYQKGDILNCQRILRETYLISLRHSVAIAVILMSLSYPFVSLALGTNFSSSHTLLWWLCPALLAYGLFEHYYNRSFWITESSWYLLMIAFKIAIINIILNIILIPKYGLLGAAAATLAAYIAGAIISGIASRRIFPLPSLLPELYHLLLACGVSGFVLTVTNPWQEVPMVLVRAALAIGVYWISLGTLSWLHRKCFTATVTEDM